MNKKLWVCYCFTLICSKYLIKEFVRALNIRNVHEITCATGLLGG